MLPYTHNLNVMYASKVIDEIQNLLHSCPYYFMHKIMLFFRFMDPMEGRVVPYLCIICTVE